MSWRFSNAIVIINKDMDSLTKKLDRFAFRFNETPQGFEGVCRCGGNFSGGQTGGQGPILFYNYDEKWHLAIDFPLPRIPWCAHCRNNTHSIEYFPDLISKWEDRARKRGANMINYEPRSIVAGKAPNILTLSLEEEPRMVFILKVLIKS
jgi:hypothetical protein